MGNEILSLREAQNPDFGVVNIFHLAFVMVLLKTEVSSGFSNLDLRPVRAAPVSRSAACLWLPSPSCPLPNNRKFALHLLQLRSQ